MEVGNELALLRLKHFLRPSLGFGSVFIATQHSLGLLEIGLSARKLSAEPLFVRDRLFHLLLGGRVRLQERLLASTLGTRAHHVRLDSLDAGLGGGNLCICLIDSCQCSLDLGILKVALAAIVLDGGFCGLDCGASLSHLSFVIVVFQLCDEIGLMYSLIVGYLDVPNDARHLGAKRSYISAHVSVVGHLIDLPAFPRVPVPTNRGHDRSCKQHDQCWNHESLPSRLRGRWSLLRWRRGGRCGRRRASRSSCCHATCGHRYFFSLPISATNICRTPHNF